MSTQFNILPTWIQIQEKQPTILSVKKSIDFIMPTVRQTATEIASVPTYANLMTKLYAKDVDAIVITINYGCVMGRGIARAMNRTFPGLDKAFLTITGKDATAVKGVRPGHPAGLSRAYLKPLHVYKSGLTARQRKNPKFAEVKKILIYFPVKKHFSDMASVDIIQESTAKLIKWMETRPSVTRIAIPKVGCGNGRLKWEIVKPLLKPLFETGRVKTYDFPLSTPIMHRPLLYDWVGSAQPHFRGNPEYAGLAAEKENAVQEARRHYVSVQQKLTEFRKKYCKDREFKHKMCGYTGYFDGNIIPCAACVKNSHCQHIQSDISHELKLALDEQDQFNKTWAGFEVNRIMKDHPGYKANSVKRCAKVLLHLKDTPTRQQKSYAKLHIRAKEVRIIYCADVRTPYGAPEIVGLIKHYLSYGSKVKVYDYTTPTLTIYTGNQFLDEFFPEEKSYENKLVETTRERLVVDQYLKLYDYHTMDSTYINVDDTTFVERHHHIKTFDKVETDVILSGSLIPNVMSDKDIEFWLLHKLYTEKVEPTLKTKSIRCKIDFTRDIWGYEDIYASDITTHEVEAVDRLYVITGKKYIFRQAAYKYVLGRELDNELFSSDLNPDWCYSTGIGKAALGSNDEYGGAFLEDDFE